LALPLIVTWPGTEGKPPTKLIASQTTADAASGGLAIRREQRKQCKKLSRPIFPSPNASSNNSKGSVDDAAILSGRPQKRLMTIIN